MWMDMSAQTFKTSMPVWKQRGKMLKKKYAADENDLYMSTLKLGQIDEDEYFWPGLV